jgi:hypothetical protein
MSEAVDQGDEVLITIYVKALNGRDITLAVGSNWTISKVKGELAQYFQANAAAIGDEITAAQSASQHRMIFMGKQLEDEHTLQDYQIEDQSTIHLVTRCFAG